MSLPESATAANASAAGLGAFIDASPSPYHVCATAAAQLRASGFTELPATQPWPGTPGRYFVQRGGGSLVAWATSAPGAPFRVIAAHTDSPNLRVKQQPDVISAGVGLVALEPYGGAWLNSWLDRDLGLSGRLALRDGNSVRQHLFRIDEPILRVPQLAIHLSDDRKAVSLDPQRHLNAIWNTRPTGKTFADLLSQQLGIPAAEILAWDAMTHDLVPSAIAGIEADLLSAPRLDNQATCYAGLHALRTVAVQDNPYTPVLALFDHEEVGSQSQRGADSDLLPVTLERIDLSQGGSRADFLARLANSVCLSGDMAHATHPNYPDRHEPGHHIALGGGPVIKVNQNLRYATDALSAAVFVAACEQAGVPCQRYTHRADLPCGSTVGPMVAAGTGISTVDVGAPQLAMHSARELMSAHDVGPYAAALTAFLAPA